MRRQAIVPAAFAAIILCACTPSSVNLQLEGVSVVVEETAEMQSRTTLKTETAVSETGSCFVHVCGAVVSPGVYELPAGSRIFDALNLAGGITEDGVPTALNFAEQIHDGEQILVPTWEEYNARWTSEENGETSSGLVNINTATKAELMTLSGIGESRAQAIIAYREEQGPFLSVEDLMLVSGIKEAAFEKIRDHITVD